MQEMVQTKTDMIEKLRESMALNEAEYTDAVINIPEQPEDEEEDPEELLEPVEEVEEEEEVREEGPAW